jgi:hypothetical protein
MTKPKRQRLNAPQPSVPVVHPTGVYKLADAAPILRTSTRRVSELVNAGLLAGRKDGHHILILGEAILAYLRTPKPTAELTPSAGGGIGAA